MSFNIRGLSELQKAITEAYSGPKAKKIKKEALNAGGDYVVEEMKKSFEAFKQTGYSRDEIMRTNARTKNDMEELKIGWDGTHERWRLIHLNEFGYTKMGKQYTPRGFGAIDKTIKSSRDEYLQTVAGKMRERL